MRLSELIRTLAHYVNEIITFIFMHTRYYTITLVQRLCIPITTRAQA